ncbi:hypothetical protein KRX11_04945 [Pasteurellaceae bacterium TAE3-ERU1]|uniref:hypothetical protein n=1 Tax=Spirabiliibacterium mucosae TaxID=28156 RepID=UPI001AAC5F8F|nr:hypothetical protein [Spirabiliibacterium mucosae]MBE2897653.1 hypothetical protein [Spirabiliibacterium mucosae]MBV7387996.1 hypothetical protein [Pasteurellaceae bacterium TAE3-ERU1]
MTRFWLVFLTALLPHAAIAASDPFNHQAPSAPALTTKANPCGEIGLMSDSPIDQYKPIGLIIHHDTPHILLKLEGDVLLAEVGNVIANEWQISEVAQRHIVLRHCRDNLEKIWQL